ncbi:MAG: molecular chaperone TorD family protein [Dehalococcoidia bacterium]|nr:molecular chaperone TorD family protein [Dehalococcoidia bacterium]
MIRSAAPPASAAESALRRAAAYELLARAFSEPAERELEALRACAAELAPALEGTPVAALGSFVPEATVASLAEAHLRLFTLSSSPDCPLFESAFVCDQPAQQTALMADVAGFYRAFGVDTPGGGIRPDDIRAELDFMAFLCRKEVYAILHLGAPRTRQTVRAERLFLAEHLGRWAPGLGLRVVARAEGSAFYLALGSALRLWVDEECARLGADPGAPLTLPRMDLSRPAPEPEDLAEGDAISGPVIDVDSIPVL